MRRLFIATLLFLTIQAKSQHVAVYKIDDLLKRYEVNNDTTYIINFWATWCAPCVKELPEFDSIGTTYSNQKVKLLLVSLDFKEDIDTKVIPFLKKKGFSAEVVLLDELNGNYFIPKVANEWSGAIPSTLIVNNKNKYRHFFEKKLSYEFLKTEIENSFQHEN